MDSVSSILRGSRPQKQPEEIAVIKDFVAREFQENCQVTIYHESIAITVNSGALASQLQLRLHELHQLCGGARKLVIRIGSVN